MAGPSPRASLIAIGVVAILVGAARGEGDAAPTQPATRPAGAQAEKEKAFAEMLSGATLVGRFSMGKADEKLKEDRYTIASARKLLGSTWLITARIQYGNRDAMNVPVPVTVEWAGDTPVLSLTDLKIPGMGTYTARVLFYRDEYAGTWSAGDHGGQMFGKVERAKAEKAPETRPAAR